MHLVHTFVIGQHPGGIYILLFLLPPPESGPGVEGLDSKNPGIFFW